ncbi:MAG: methyltransferase, partial [Gammaproteobacteria bacterium]|nr:methyltransferase [Gammaproteobacteria bacterium]
MLNTSAVIERNLSRLQGRILVLGCMDEMLASLLEGREAWIVSDHYGVYARMVARLGERALFGLPDDNGQQLGLFDRIVVLMPKSKPELDLRLRFAASRLNPDGTVWLLGEKKEGIAGGATLLAQQYTQTQKGDTARHCQLWTAQYPREAVAFHRQDALQSWTVSVGDTSLVVRSYPGVFSHGRLDEATQMLIGTFDQAPRGPVLDFACGAGVIGAWLRKRWPALSVDLLDVQAQAVESARETLQANGLEAQVIASDGLSGCTRKYATIVTNPPFHEGVRTDPGMTRRFLDEMAQRL